MSQRVIITPDENGNNPVVIADLSQNQNMLPVNVSYHESTTIQTHNAVSVAGSGLSDDTSWRDTIGYSDLRGTLLNNATTTSNMILMWSNDGSNVHGYETLCSTGGSNQYAQGQTPIKARYVKVRLSNADTIAHTESAWLYLTT